MTFDCPKPVVREQMLIRCPVARVFEAFVDPEVTSRFWFTRGSGRLEPGARVRWEWEMYGASTQVEVKRVEPNERILVEWDGPEKPTSVEWTFEPQGSDATLVVIRNWGFDGDPDKVVATALDAAGGFAFVLAALKAYLEHGMALKLVEDHAPAAYSREWQAARGA
jgi:uncharacterized protein YndB with AHSA1/START domain